MTDAERRQQAWDRIEAARDLLGAARIDAEVLYALLEELPTKWLVRASMIARDIAMPAPKEQKV